MKKQTKPELRRELRKTKALLNSLRTRMKKISYSNSIKSQEIRYLRNRLKKIKEQIDTILNRGKNY